MHLNHIPADFPGQLQTELVEVITEVARNIADNYEQPEPGGVYQRPEDARNYRFGAGTDGAIGCDVLIPLSYLDSTGAGFNNEDLDSEVDSQKEAWYNYAVNAFVRDYPQIPNMLGGRGVTPSNLEEHGRSDLAETLWEYHEAALEDEFVTVRVCAFFYSPDSRNPGRNTPTGHAELQLRVYAFIGDGCQIGPGISPKSFDLWTQDEVIENLNRPYATTEENKGLREGLRIFEEHAHEKV